VEEGASAERQRECIVSPGGIPPNTGEYVRPCSVRHSWPSLHIQRRVAAAVQGPLPPPLDAAPPSDVGGLKVEVWVRQEVVPCERESGNISAFSYGQTGAWMERIRAQCDSPKSTTGVSRASQVSECARSSSVKHDTRAERKGGVGGTAHPRRKREGDAVRADPLQRGLTRGPGPRLLDVVPVPVVGVRVRVRVGGTAHPRR
jgi:hypothetical protein